MTTLQTPDARWYDESAVSLADFRRVVEQTTQAQDYPYAAAIADNVVMYDAAQVRERVADAGCRRAVQAELMRALADGPGIVVVRGGYADLSVIDRTSEAFARMIAEQHASGAQTGDHFGVPGTNDRVWNALQKLAVREPETFFDYYRNDIIALGSEAWLGPHYQVTSSVNVVNPGGAAQTAHRDYHLGFQADPMAMRYPAHMHRCAPVLTLQAAIAHCDMPIETGPTMYLPYSQRYAPGYLAFRRAEFVGYFDDNLVQLPLRKGDVVFFNPALFHAAGTNRTSDVRRTANLLQVSSAFGRAMESINREVMCNSLYPVLRRRRDDGVDEHDLRNVVAASAEGYAFPTNLDSDQPVDSLVPETQATILWRAIEQTWPPARLAGELSGLHARNQADEVGQTLTHHEGALP